MKIYFVGQIISEKIYEKYYEECKILNDNAANAFYNSVLNGFIENDIEVSYRSQVPADIIEECRETTNNSLTKCKYVRHKSNPVIRVISNIVESFAEILKWSQNEKNEFVLFNALRISQVVGAYFACKLKKIKTIAIITDVPGYTIMRGKDSIFEKIDAYVKKKYINKFDYYILLSEKMREVLNINKKPYIVMEGLYDQNIQIEKREVKATFDIMYAGSLNYMYGIMNLVEACKKIDKVRLHIYGEGEAAKNIADISKHDAHVVYMGCVDRAQILKKEKEVALLVNPRPVEEIFARYSFSAKNIEYMASGTPVLLTAVPSLPEEYKRFLYVINDNKIDTIYRAIVDLKKKYYEDVSYFEKGYEAQKFVKEKKNSKQQIGRIIHFLVEN